MGATTIWERWDALAPDGTMFDPGMNSFNHYAYGAVCQWLFEGVAGLRPLAGRPGLRAASTSTPAIIPALGFVAAGTQSPRGEVAAEWRIDGDRVTYTSRCPRAARAASSRGAAAT